MSELTHFDDKGASRMVDTSAKPETLREARASGQVRMASATAGPRKFCSRTRSTGGTFESSWTMTELTESSETAAEMSSMQDPVEACG